MRVQIILFERRFLLTFHCRTMNLKPSLLHHQSIPHLSCPLWTCDRTSSYPMVHRYIGRLEPCLRVAVLNLWLNVVSSNGSSVHWLTWTLPLCCVHCRHSNIKNWKLCDGNQWLDGLKPVEAESVENKTHLVFHRSRLQQIHKGHRRCWINHHKSSEPHEEPRSDTWRPTQTVEAHIRYHQVVLLTDSTIEAHPSLSGLSVSSNCSSFLRHQSGGLLVRITSCSTNEADWPNTENSQRSCLLAASCSSLWLQSTREGQRSASLAV